MKQNSRRMDYLLRGALCALLLWTGAAHAAKKICDVAIEPVWAEADTLAERLRNDAFAEAFGVYVEDLKKNRADFEEWRRRGEQWAAANCRPLELRLDRHQAEVQAHAASCPSVVPDQATADRCNENARRLNGQARALDAAIDRVSAAWEKRNDDFYPILRAQERAVGRARDMLDSANIQNAFRLYAFSVAKRVNAGQLTSCDALAQMSNTLAGKTGSQYGRHLAVMGSVLASEDNPIVIDSSARSVRFTASGFQRRFVGPPGRGLERANQVRHATAYLMAGAEFGASGAMFASYMQDKVRHLLAGRVPEEHDYLLGIAAGEIGRDLRAHALSVEALGSRLRARLCGT